MAHHGERERWLLPPKELKGGTCSDHKPELRNGDTLLRKRFSVREAIRSAFIDITADDYYKLYINGRFIGQGPAPGYYFHYWYNRYDISDVLCKGENVVAVHVYYQGLINRVW